MRLSKLRIKLHIVRHKARDQIFQALSPFFCRGGALVQGYRYSFFCFVVPVNLVEWGVCILIDESTPKKRPSGTRVHFQNEAKLGANYLQQAAIRNGNCETRLETTPSQWQTQLHIHRRDKKRTAGDLDQRTQGCYQTGRNRNIGNCRTRLGIPSPDTMRRNQCTRSSHQNPLLITETLHICLSHSQLLHINEGVAIPKCGQLVLTHAVMTNSIHPTLFQLRQGSCMLCRMHDFSLQYI